MKQRTTMLHSVLILNLIKILVASHLTNFLNILELREEINYINILKLCEFKGVDSIIKTLRSPKIILINETNINYLNHKRYYLTHTLKYYYN